jgi:peptide/nickel transport system substrate-binding protein
MDGFVGSSIFGAGALVLVIAATSTAEAETLRYANKGDLKSLDPHTLDETTANAHVAHATKTPSGCAKHSWSSRLRPGSTGRWPSPTRVSVSEWRRSTRSKRSAATVHNRCAHARAS